MSDEWQPEAYEDAFNERVKKLLKDKRKGESTKPAPKAREATEVVDLYDALSASVEERRSGRKGSGRKGSGRKGSGRKRSGKSVDPADLTRADLDRMARELDVSGRSKMSKQELAEAVAEASSSSGGRKRAS
jgi:DNA end-binding protein Ku